MDCQTYRHNVMFLHVRLNYNSHVSEDINAHDYTEFSLFCEDVGVGVIWEKLLTTSELLCIGICSLKALKFKCLKYAGENTDIKVVRRQRVWDNNNNEPTYYTDGGSVT